MSINTKEPSQPGAIPPVVIPDRALQISFKYLECDHSRYALSNCSAEFWQLLARELKRYSSFSVDQFNKADNDYARHYVNIDDPRVDATPLAEVQSHFEWSDPWQFGVGPRALGKRVIGILVDVIFYITLLDENHQTYTKHESAERSW